MSMLLIRPRFLLPLALVLLSLSFVAWRFVLSATAVVVAQVESGTLPVQVHGPGSLQARIATTIAARINGRITTLPIDQGASVQAGTLLATLDADEINNRQRSASASLNASRHQEVAAKAAVDHARASLILARQELTRARSLFAQQLIPQSELDKAVAAEAVARGTLSLAEATLKARQAETARNHAEADVLDTQLGYTRITAPFAGLVVRRYAEPGQTVGPGTPLFRLIDPATLWVVMRVDESQSGAIRVGLPARIALRTGADIGGHVARIGLQSDPGTRELEVDVTLDSTPARYAIDEEAQVLIRTGQAQGMIFPASAIIHRGTQTGVLQIKAGRAGFTPVEIGAVARGKAVATSGLESGASVIIRPAGIKPGSRVRPAGPAAP